MRYADRITFNPEQCGGRPCIRSMRIRVKDVLDLLAARVPEAEILADYLDLEPDDISACLEYAAAQIDHTVLGEQFAKFIVDAQLPPAIAQWLRDEGHDARTFLYNHAPQPLLR